MKLKKNNKQQELELIRLTWIKLKLNLHDKLVYQISIIDAWELQLNKIIASLLLQKNISNRPRGGAVVLGTGM